MQPCGWPFEVDINLDSGSGVRLWLPMARLVFGRIGFSAAELASLIGLLRGALGKMGLVRLALVGELGIEEPLGTRVERRSADLAERIETAAALHRQRSLRPEAFTPLVRRDQARIR